MSLPFVEPAPFDPSAPDPPESAGQEEPSMPTTAIEEAALIRDLILRAHSDVVPEMVRGNTLHELLGSLPAAQDAWRNALERVHSTGSVTSEHATPNAPPVPAGATVRSAPVDLESLSPLAKIRAGVR
jgi:hypothetical protein